MGSAFRATGQLRHQWACPITRVSAHPLWSVWFQVQNKSPLMKVKSRQPHNWPNRSWRSFCHCAYSQLLLVGKRGARLWHFGSLPPEANKDKSWTCGTVGQGALLGHRYVERQRHHTDATGNTCFHLLHARQGHQCWGYFRKQETTVPTFLKLTF